jgi:hypothetical protein
MKAQMCKKSRYLFMKTEIAGSSGTFPWTSRLQEVQVPNHRGPDVKEVQVPNHGAQMCRKFRYLIMEAQT